MRPQFSANRPTDFEAGRSGAGVGSWRRRGSESSTCACPHGPGAAASSDRTAIRPVLLQRSASRAPRAHHFCHRLRLRAQKMVRPTRAARAHGRSRGGRTGLTLLRTVSHACDVLSRLRHLAGNHPNHLPRGSVQKLSTLPMTRKSASWSWPWWVKSPAMSRAALVRRCSRLSSRAACCCASTTSSFAAE